MSDLELQPEGSGSLNNSSTSTNIPQSGKKSSAFDWEKPLPPEVFSDLRNKARKWGWEEELDGEKDSLGHGIGRIKAAAYAAVPQLIEKGKIFSRESNWKNRGYDTVVMLAPLKINGIDYVGEVVVKQGAERQGFYLHEVEVKEKLANVFKTATGSTPPTSKPYCITIIGKSQELI